MNNECSICLESIEPNNIVLTKCNHTFHCNCILSWLKSDNLKQCSSDNPNGCPNCREPISNDYIKENYSLQLQDYKKSMKIEFLVACKKYTTKLLDKVKSIISNNNEQQRSIEIGNYVKYYKHLYTITFNIRYNNMSAITLCKIQEQLHREYNVTFTNMEVLQLLSDTMLYIKHEITLNIPSDNSNAWLTEFLNQLDIIERELMNNHRKKEQQRREIEEHVLRETHCNLYNKKRKYK